MKMFNKALFATLVMSATASAVAGTTADLTVTGTITPVACTPSFVGGGAVDYGKISPTKLSRIADTKLAEKSVAYTITCDAPVVVATRWTDARAGTAGALSRYASFGLGKAGNANIGGYSIIEKPQNLLTDGKSGGLLFSLDNGATWKAVSNATQLINDPDGGLVSYSSVGSMIPAAYKTLSGQLDVQAYIGPTADFDFSQDIQLDGLSTMEVVYL